jgi:hypothetical protein
MTRLRAIVFSVMLLAVGYAAPAAAASGHENGCTVSNVSFGVGPQGSRLYVMCTSGTFYYMYLNGSTNAPNGTAGCATASIDALKLWQSEAIAAKLSGKTIQIWWTDNSGTARAGCTFEGTAGKSIDSLDFNG